MATRALPPVAIALLMLAACGKGGAPEAPPSASTAASPPGLVVPVAAGPEPEPSPSAIPSVDPSAEAPDAATTPTLPMSYPPRDECAKLSGFAGFRDKLFAAAKAKDVEAFVALADPEIHLDFGGGAGADELRKRLSDPKAPLWGEVGELAGLGCAADGGLATLPWIFSRLPDGYDDAAIAMYGVGPQLVLRSKPSAAARPLATLTWPVVELEGVGFDPKAPFAKVKLSDGTVGYLETAGLRSLLDYRLVAERQSGQWRITALIAGD